MGALEPSMILVENPSLSVENPSLSVENPSLSVENPSLLVSITTGVQRSGGLLLTDETI